MDDGERYIQVQYLAQPSALLRKNPATCQTATSVPSEHVTAICGCGCGLGDHVHTPQTILLLDMLQQCWWWCSMWINARCRGLLARAHYRVPSCSFRLVPVRGLIVGSPILQYHRLAIGGRTHRGALFTPHGSSICIALRLMASYLD